jgi:ribonuclease HI
MVAAIPHYLLVTEAASSLDPPPRAGAWRFVLSRSDGRERVEAADVEPDVRGERLQLLAVLRGLEAIDQPSRVTLVTPGPWVSRAIRRDLGVWREMNWTWERFGELHPIKHADLWRRIDRALQIHTVQCRSLQQLDAFSVHNVLEETRDRAITCRDRLSQLRWPASKTSLVASWRRMSHRLARQNRLEWLTGGRALLLAGEAR